MGLVVNKSFKKVRNSISSKSEKLRKFLNDYEPFIKNGKWSVSQNNLYQKLQGLCDSLVEEIANLDEIEVPEYKK